MVIASSGAGVLLLGLSEANLERLQQGMPIRVSRETHGIAVPPNLKIFIIVGKDEAAIEADLRKFGVIGPATVMNQERPQ